MSVQVQALACPSCGAQVELRGFANTLTAVCPHCTAVLDTSTPALQILHKFQSEQRRTPTVPLGTRGRFENTTYEVIGFQTRAIEVEGITYEWAEYVLLNPYHGFRYLSEYKGHWSYIWPVRKSPVAHARAGRKESQMLNGRVYGHFQHAEARTVFVLGEFPWRVEVGETVQVDDYSAPPYVLSAERYGAEVTWSEGRYCTGKEIWKALNLTGSPPAARGIYLNQPSPYPARTASAMKLLLVFEALLVAMLMFFSTTARRDVAFKESHRFTPGVSAENSFVTPVFELQGHTSNVEVRTATDLDNNWTFFGYSLINADTGQAWDFGREVGYYYGRDSDGSWSEGGRNDTAILPSIPPGRYYLRVEPESDTNARTVDYTIEVVRDVPTYTYFLIAGLVLILPVIVLGWRSYRFEYDRWQESDYATSSGSSGDDD